MNIRKPVDYSAMFVALDTLVTEELPQMKLCCEIGRLVSGRPEKGASVAAAEYLQRRYPEASGFSPRNVRRMRDFYRLYESTPQLMEQALCLNWTQNVVIMEAALSMEERAWYFQVCVEHSWSKLELQRQIDCNVHLKVSLDQIPPICYNNCSGEQEMRVSQNPEKAFYPLRQHTQEIGYPVYLPARRKLAEHGIQCDGYSDLQLTNQGYDEYNLLVGMDQTNLCNMYHICGRDYAGKMHHLLDFTDYSGGVADHGTRMILRKHGVM